jgi:hypothetical protein
MDETVAQEVTAELKDGAVEMVTESFPPIGDVAREIQEKPVLSISQRTAPSRARTRGYGSRG